MSERARARIKCCYNSSARLHFAGYLHQRNSSHRAQRRSTSNLLLRPAARYHHRRHCASSRVRRSETDYYRRPNASCSLRRAVARTLHGRFSVSRTIRQRTADNRDDQSAKARNSTLRTAARSENRARSVLRAHATHANGASAARANAAATSEERRRWERRFSAGKQSKFCCSNENQRSSRQSPALRRSQQSHGALQGAKRGFERQIAGNSGGRAKRRTRVYAADYS